MSAFGRLLGFSSMIPLLRSCSAMVHVHASILRALHRMGSRFYYAVITEIPGWLELSDGVVSV